MTKIMTATKIDDMETGVRQQPLSEEGAGRRFVEGSQVQGGLDSSHVEPDAVRSALFDEYWALPDLKGDGNLMGTQHNDGGYDSDSGIDEGLYGTPSLLLPLEARCSQPLTSSRYTSSLRGSVLDYPFERGRRYHVFRAGSTLSWLRPSNDL